MMMSGKVGCCGADMFCGMPLKASEQREGVFFEGMS